MTRSTLPITRPVRVAKAVRKAGLSGAARGSVVTFASSARTHPGSSSVKTTACALNESTPAVRAAGCGTTVNPPSEGGKTPRAASSRRSASVHC